MALAGCAASNPEPASCPLRRSAAQEQQRELEQALAQLDETLARLDRMDLLADQMFEGLGVRTEVQDRLRLTRWRTARQANELRHLLQELREGR